MKNKLIYIFFVIAVSFSHAQSFDMEWLKGISPRNIGPSGMSGRITAIDVVHSQPYIIYVGTASGGLWKSTNRGITWQPIFNDQVTASIGSVAIQQSNPSVIWAGTGEGNPRNSLNGGYGIYKSLDGGKNWELMGLEKTRHIHRIIINPTNPDIIYVASIGSPWGEHSQRGVYKTEDGGLTWRRILFINNKTGAADLVMDPKNPNKLIAAMWEHKRDPWFFKSGGKGSGLHITFDGGNTWQKKTAEDGLPKGELGRIGVAIASSNTDIIYAIVEAEKNALYKSIDGGFKWEKVNDKKEIGNRPFYYSEIYVDPQNENRLYSIFTYVNVSNDGGKNFSRLVPTYNVNNGVHPDHHAWWINPKDGSYIIDGNDGGLNISNDKGASWRFIGNIPVAQFYHINVDNSFPYNVYGGMQDNGSWKGPAYVWRAQGIRNSYWQEISFGDGFDVIPDNNNSRYGYSMSQRGRVIRYDSETGNNYPVRPTHPDPNIRLRFNWNAAIGKNKNILYFGSQYVHKSMDNGLTWKIISPDLTTNDTLKQKQHKSGGLTIDATGAENYCSLLVIEPSTIQDGLIWTGSDDGLVYITKDSGKNWKEVSKNIKGLPRGSWITQIKASNKNQNEALLVANNYRRFDYTPYVFRTKNSGKTWERIVDENDVKGYSLSIVEDINSTNLLFLGTDDGLYLSLDRGENWKKFDSETFPTVSTKDLVIQPREEDLVIGTFGRAVWVLDDIRPLRAVADNIQITKKTLHLFTPPTAYLSVYQQPNGSRFPADAMYSGENRKRGAMITYFITPLKDTDEKVGKKENKEVEESKKDTLFVKIYKNDKHIRTLKQKVPKKKGFYRIYWDLSEKGVPSPSRKIKKDDEDEAGVKVLPGEYRVVANYKKIESEILIKVETDPRLETNIDDLKEIYEYSKKTENILKLAYDAVKQLVESKNNVQDIQKRLREIDKEKYEKNIKYCEKTQEKIDEKIDLFLGKENKKQGIVRNPTPSAVNRIYNAYYYVTTRKNGITLTEKKLIENAKNDLMKSLEKTNIFFENDWKNFKDSISGVSLLNLKNTQIFEIN